MGGHAGVVADRLTVGAAVDGGVLTAPKVDLKYVGATPPHIPVWGGKREAAAALLAAGADPLFTDTAGKQSPTQRCR